MSKFLGEYLFKNEFPRDAYGNDCDLSSYFLRLIDVCPKIPFCRANCQFALH